MLTKNLAAYGADTKVVRTTEINCSKSFTCQSHTRGVRKPTYQ